MHWGISVCPDNARCLVFSKSVLHDIKYIYLVTEIKLYFQLHNPGVTFHFFNQQ